MKKLLLSIMLMLVGTTSWAQSGWNDPSGKYQTETVVYAVVDCGNNEELYLSKEAPAIAAFIDGEIRALTTQYDVVGENKLRLYTLRIGGVSGDDDDKVISFKLYDNNRGLTYPLTPMYTTSDGTFQTEIKWSGDKTLVEPSNYFTLAFKPINEVKLYIDEVETDRFVMEVGDKKPMSDFSVRLLDIDDQEATTPEEDGEFIIEGQKGTIVEKVNIDGVDYVQANGTSTYSDESGEYLFELIGYYHIGANNDFFKEMYAKVEPKYINVESIAIEDISTYLGTFKITPNIVYNNGESQPTTPGVTFTTENQFVVSVVDGELMPARIGQTTITATAVDNENVSTTFTITVVSALNGITLPEASAELYMDNRLTLPTPTFDWIKDANGNPVIDIEPHEQYAVTSSDPEIIEINEIVGEAGIEHIAVPLKCGTATITYESLYDNSKKVEFTITVKRKIESVEFISVNGVEIPSVSVTEPVVNISLGREVTAIARLNPEDADYNTFSMSILNSDGMDIAQSPMVEVISSTIENNVLTYIFKIVEKPVDQVRLCVTADEQFNDYVSLNITTDVTAIELSETEKTVWFSEGNTTDFTITATIVPEDATNGNIIIASDNEEVVTVNDNHVFSVVGKGTATITFTSESNPEVTATCVVTAKKKVTSIAMPDMLGEQLYNDGTPVNFDIAYYPTDADFDPEMLNIGVAESEIFPDGWDVISFEHVTTADGMETYSIKANCLWSTVNIEANYDTSEQGDSEQLQATTYTTIAERMEIASGWNWISFVASYFYGLHNYSNEIQEVRSKLDLVYNDPLWGFFGTLENMDHREAYKLNAKTSFTLDLAGEMSFSENGDIESKILEKGWNWVSYPYEYKYAVADIFDASKLSEGDIILSQSRGFAMVTSEGTWEGSLTELNPYEGYLIYSNSEETIELEMPGRFTLPQGTKSTLAAIRGNRDTVWMYDASRFANTMAIIGKMDIEDADDYSIGAFVGDDCRGEGKIINGRVYVTASGTAGEQVTFRLYNKWTKEYYAVEAEVAFAEMVGSYKEPIDMGAVLGTTDINDINTIDEAAIVAIYDMKGRRVTEMSEGIYILKIRQGDTIVTKKVKK